MNNENKLEDIKIEDKLSVFSYPIEKMPYYSNFLLGKFDFWHHGIHISSMDAVQSIYDAQIIAYRFCKNYKHRNFDIDNAKFPSNVFVNFLERTKYADIDKIFIKDEKGFYKLKDNATDIEKEKAFIFINKLYSNSFILLKHIIKNCDNKEIIFYSLYNHLKPLSRMTLEQKLNLFFYFSKAEIKINNVPYFAYCKFFDVLQQKDVLLPAELPLSKDNNEKSYIKWKINNNNYEALIDSKYLRKFDDGHVEIKRPGNDKSKNLTNKSDYVSTKSVIVLFDSGKKNSRLVKQYLYFHATDKINKLFEISNSDFDNWLTNNNDDGLRVKYNNYYFFIYPINKKELKDAYNSLNKERMYKESKGSVYIICSLTQGLVLQIMYFNGRENFYFTNPNNKRRVNLELESYYIQLQKVYLIENEKRKLVISPYNIIPCETNVKVTSNYSATFNGQEYHGFIDQEYVDTKQMKIKKACEYEGEGVKWQWSNDYLLVYDSSEIENRSVIDAIHCYYPFELADKKELIRFRIKNEGDEDSLLPQFDKGINIKYKKVFYDPHINNYLSGFIYLSFQKQSAASYAIKKDKKDFLVNISKWLLSVDEERLNEISKSFNSIEFTLYKNNEYVINDEINYPKEKNVKKGDVIGYTGYSIADEDEKTRNSNEDASSMHFEIFTSDNNFMNYIPSSKFDIEKKRLPCYCKINSDCTVYQGKIKTICGSSIGNSINSRKSSLLGNNSIIKNTIKKFNSVVTPLANFFMPNIFSLDLADLEESSKYENICYEEIERGYLTEGQYYSKLKPIAKIIPMDDNEYFRRSDIDWNKDYSFYFVKEDIEVQVYNNINEPIEGKKIKLYKNLRCLGTTHYSAYEETIKDKYKFWGPGEFDLPEDDTLKKDELRLRRPEFYLEKITVDIEPVYIKTSDLDGSEYRDCEDKNRQYFFYNGKKLDKNKLTQKPSGTCWDTQNSNYEEISLKKDDSKKYQFCYEFMHEYDSLDEKHKTLKTWCKIKSDAGTEYWVNKDDFDFKSKDGSNIGVVFYDRWDDFFEEMKLDKYGTYKCEKGKQDAFIKDYKLKELGINSVQDIPASSKTLKKFYYNAESEWSDNQKITDEYVNLSPIQKKETTEYRKDLAFITDTFVNALSKQKFSKKNYYFNPVAFLNHLDKVATPAEFNPYLEKRYAEIYSDKTAPNIDLNTFVKDTPGFAPRWDKGWWSADSNPNTDGYSAVNGFFNHIYTKVGPKYHHEGIDFRGPEKTEIVSFINAKVIAYGWMTDSNGSIYGSGYGQTIFLYDTQNKGIYQLSHLYEFDKDIYVGKQYHPGDVVAKVGNSGHGLVNDNDHWSAHLHLSYYDKFYDNKLDKFVYREDNKIKRSSKKFNDVWESLRNPFDHNSSEKHGGFNK